MAYEGSESAWDNFGKFIYQSQPETKTLIRKFEKILNKLYRQNFSLLFNETYIHTQKLAEKFMADQDTFKEWDQMRFIISTESPLQSTHSFCWCYSFWIPLIENPQQQI